MQKKKKIQQQKYIYPHNIWMNSFNKNNVDLNLDFLYECA